MMELSISGSVALTTCIFAVMALQVSSSATVHLNITPKSPVKGSDVKIHCRLGSDDSSWKRIELEAGEPRMKAYCKNEGERQDKSGIKRNGNAINPDYGCLTPAGVQITVYRATMDITGTVICRAILETDDGSEFTVNTTTTLTLNASVTALQVHPQPVIEGQKVSVTCVADRGYPERNVSMEYFGIPQSAKSSLQEVLGSDGVQRYSVIWRATESQNDMTVGCRVKETGIGKNTSLVVHYAPHSLKISPRYEVAPGGDISCSSKGYPEPNVTLEMSKLNGKEKKQVIFGVSTAKLSVPTTADGNFAFICTATNSAGVKKTSALFRVAHAPHSLKIFPNNKVFAGETISCSSKGQPTPHVMLRILRFNGIEKQIFYGDSSAELIVPATAEGNYTFLCRASNGVGENETTVLIPVKQKRIPTALDVLNDAFDLDSEIKLKCSPKDHRMKLASITVTFANGQYVMWKNGSFHDRSGIAFDKSYQNKGSSISFSVRAKPSLQGHADCVLESANHSSFGKVVKEISIQWKPKITGIYVSNRLGESNFTLKENTTVYITCQVEVGHPKTNDGVTLSGFPMPGDLMTTSKVVDGWTYKNVTKTVKLTWKHNEKMIWCSLGDLKIKRILHVDCTFISYE